MNKLSVYRTKAHRLCCGSWTLMLSTFCCFQSLLTVSPFLINSIFYLVSLSCLGFGILKCLNPRIASNVRIIDLFFTSVSSTTLSSMSAVEMEVFSNPQLIVMSVLMFLGGEIFISMVGVHWRSFKTITAQSNRSPLSSPPTNNFEQIKLHAVTMPDSESVKFESQQDVLPSPNLFLKHKSIKFLGFVVLGYFLVIQAVGIGSVLLYLNHVQSAGDVLRTKGLKAFTFAIFTIVSSFSNCGFIPTNENMVAFRTNSGLLWILIPQILLGNTLFPCALRLVLWVLGKRFKKRETRYLLERTKEAGYSHLLPGRQSLLLLVTVSSLILVGFTMFCSMEWNSTALRGMNAYQKAVGVAFQCANARHSGETIVDLSTIAPAILVFFVFLMYLPPYALVLPPKKNDEGVAALESEGMKQRSKNTAESLLFSQITYLVIFIILICIAERKNLKEDPLNFSVLNITVEVISAYGNVGFTTGYSCERQLRPDPSCVNKWYGFSGKWSDKGKVILMIVMFFGRLKKFSKNGGQAWTLYPEENECDQTSSNRHEAGHHVVLEMLQCK